MTRPLRRLVPVAALALLLAACASPQAELEDAVADLTDAANSRNPTEVMAQANEVITLVEQQRERLGTEQADRIVELAETIGSRAELLRPVLTPTPSAEPVPTTQAPEPEDEPEPTQEPEPEPTQEPVETEEPEPEPTQEPVETEEPEPEPTEAPETTVPEVEVTAPPAASGPTPASSQVAPAAASRTSPPPSEPPVQAKPRKSKAPRA